MKKEWITLGGAGLLAIALIVGVIAVTNGVKTKPGSGSSAESTAQTLDGTQNTADQTKPADETTGPEQETSDGTTAPTGETVDIDSTDGTTSGANDDSGGSGGFGERNPDNSDPAKPTNPQPKPTDPAQPGQTDPTQPESTEPTTKEEMTYKAYMALSENEKIDFQNLFSSRAAFLNWYNAAKKVYDDSKNKVTIGDGESIDLEDYINDKK